MRGKLEDGNKEGEMRVEGRRVFFFCVMKAINSSPWLQQLPWLGKKGGPSAFVIQPRSSFSSIRFLPSSSSLLRSLRKKKGFEQG